jgi:tRNA G18 (ribose-2'-O)-methylase SpoU
MTRTILISDPSDPRIVTYRDIKERDVVGRDGLFVAEGKVVLAMLLASARYRPQSLLIAERLVPALSALLAQVPEDVPIYAAAQPVLDAIAGFAIHRGILAIGARAPMLDANALLAGLPDRATILLLSAIANHDNMGGLFRNAAAFGADAILLDADCCDPLYRKAIRVSVGAALLVPFAFVARDADPVDLLARHGFTTFSLSPSGSAELGAVARTARTAILLGAEGPGLSPALLERTRTVRIAMAPGFDSLNVATTAGIALHHLTRPV